MNQPAGNDISEGAAPTGDSEASGGSPFDLTREKGAALASVVGMMMVYSFLMGLPSFLSIRVFSQPLVIGSGGEMTPVGWGLLLYWAVPAAVIIGAYYRYAPRQLRAWLRVVPPSPRDLNVGSYCLVGLIVVKQGSQMVTTGAPSRFPEMTDPLSIILVTAVTALVVVPANEILFRGVIQQRLREQWGPLGGIGLTSVFEATLITLLSLPILSTVGGAVAAVIPISTALAGVVLGFGYEHSQGIATPVVVAGSYALLEGGAILLL
jgi:membrane protease YdiL (CAAX protease family)